MKLRIAVGFIAGTILLHNGMNFIVGDWLATAQTVAGIGFYWLAINAVERLKAEV